MPTRHRSRAKAVRASAKANYVRRHRKAARIPGVKANTSKFVPAHRRYTPELIANGRVRYENTTESVAAIAADFDMMPSSFRRMARRFKWVRHNTRSRDLPLAARLHAHVQALETKLGLPKADEVPDAEMSPLDRLEQAVMKELSTVKAMRAQLGALPMRGRDAERTARTLSTLTETLNKLQRMRCAMPQESREGAQDLTPAEEIQAFRQELAHRLAGLYAERDEQSVENEALQNALWPD
jgi:hypothetical protein